MKQLLVFAFLALAFFHVKASDPDTTAVELNEEQLAELYQHFVDSVNNSLHYETGTVSIGNGIASIKVPGGFKFLIGKDAEMVLTEIWGNPPSDPGYGSLGMLFPADSDPFDDGNYAINITYAEEGFVDDKDAKDIDYDDLLKQMKEDTKAENELRVQKGYIPIELVGWASAPYYDAANKKLHWAKELKFGENPSNTLNYNIRVLGRKGFLELNVIGDMAVLPEVKEHIGGILPAVEFNEGNRYLDFDSSVDKIAVYGIGGLIAGKVLLKAGILAKLGIMLAKFWKVIALAVAGAFPFLKKFFGKKDETTPEAGA